MAGEDWQGANVHFLESRAGDARGHEVEGVSVKEDSWGYRLLVVDDPDGNQIFFNYPNETASGKIPSSRASMPALHHQSLLRPFVGSQFPPHFSSLKGSVKVLTVIYNYFGKR